MTSNALRLCTVRKVRCGDSGSGGSSQGGTVAGSGGEKTRFSPDNRGRAGLRRGEGIRLLNRGERYVNRILREFDFGSRVYE